MVKALHRKLWRELWQLRGQALAIAIVIAGGITTLVMSLSSLDALYLTREAFYRDYRYAHVFASLKRGPESLRETVQAIPGVQHVETRVVAQVNLDISDFDDAATGLLISLPDGRNAELNRLHLRAGRLPLPRHDREVVISEAFAEAHAFVPGDTIGAIINGHRQTLVVVGIALSPEYIYQIKPGDLFPDFERYGILWMNRTPLAHAYDMDGAFNDIVLTLSRDAVIQNVLARLDALLNSYGGLGAIDREDQTSHKYLREELSQLANMAKVFPVIFMGVAAFLLNVVFTRLIRAQREQIAVLKAFGYSHLEVGLHYLQLVMLIILAGLALGLLAGVWTGQQLSQIYQHFFRFPFLEYRLQPQVIALGAVVTGAAGLVGALSAVYRAVRLPPAEAMRPEPPPIFRATVIERLGLQQYFTQPSRIILRNIERRPWNALFTVIGIAFGCGILVLGRFQESAIDFMLTVQFGFAQRADLTVTFVEPTSRRIIHDFAALTGVQYVEPYRVAPATLRAGWRRHRTAIQGIAPAGDLRRVLDTKLRVIELPLDGVLLTDYLAHRLGVIPGDTLFVEFHEGQRETVAVTVAGLVKEYLGVSAYMRLETLNRLLREGSAVSGAYLAIDSRERTTIIRRLKDAPRIAGVNDRQSAIESFYESMAEIVLTFAFFTTVLAGSIAFGVVYNSSRIALAERSRELASLRVLGFTQWEVRYILLGELGLLTAAAIPLGFAIGRLLAAYVVQGIESDLYRVPVVLEPPAYAFAAVVVLLSSAVSAILVNRQLTRLDLVEVLKTKE